MNSGLVVTTMVHHVSGNEIHISVVLNTILNTSHTSRCTEIGVGDISAGEYKVLYEEQNKTNHVLGTVTFR